MQLRLPCHGAEEGRGSWKGFFYMWLPTRLRGLMLGMGALGSAPLIAIVSSSGTMALAVPAASAHTAGGVRESAASIANPADGRLVPARDPELTRPSNDLGQPDNVPPVDMTVMTRRGAVVHVSAVAPASAPLPSGAVTQIIEAAAVANSVDPGWMVRIAQCESGLNPNSNGTFKGLFQFVPSTFVSNGGNANAILDASAQANVAAKMLAHGGAHSWPVCSNR